MPFLPTVVLPGWRVCQPIGSAWAAAHVCGGGGRFAALGDIHMVAKNWDGCLSRPWPSHPWDHEVGPSQVQITDRNHRHVTM